MLFLDLFLLYDISTFFLCQTVSATNFPESSKLPLKSKAKCCSSQSHTFQASTFFPMVLTEVDFLSTQKGPDVVSHLPWKQHYLSRKEFWAGKFAFCSSLLRRLPKLKENARTHTTSPNLLWLCLSRPVGTWLGSWTFSCKWQAPNRMSIKSQRGIYWKDSRAKGKPTWKNEIAKRGLERI